MRDLHFKSVLITLVLLLTLNHTSATTSYYERKAEGWHFYEDKCPVLSDQKKGPFKRDESKKTKTPQDDSVARLKSFKEEVERLKAVAVLSPTYQNMKAYMEIQKELMDRSTRFAQKWMEVVYTTPQLDYTLKHPTSQAARHVYLDQQRERMDKDIRALSKTHGLFFFYSSGCSYCKEFAPILRSFSEKYGWEVLAISMDGKILPEFPKSRVDNGTAKTLGVQFVPTLLAVEPKRGKVFPLSYGMSTHDQIEDRIRVLIIKEGNL